MTEIKNRNNLTTNFTQTQSSKTLVPFRWYIEAGIQLFVSASSWFDANSLTTLHSKLTYLNKLITSCKANYTIFKKMVVFHPNLLDDFKYAFFVIFVV